MPIRGAVQGIVLLYVLLRNGNEEESDERKSRTSGITTITSIMEPVIAITVFTAVTWTPETSRFSDDLSLVFGLPLLMTGSLLLIGQ